MSRYERKNFFLWDDEDDYFDPDNEDFDPYDLEDDVHVSNWVRGSNWNGDV